MTDPPEDRICALCDAPAVTTCPRCDRLCCGDHRLIRSPGWPEEAYNMDELCLACVDSLNRSSRAVARVVVAASSFVLGGALSGLLVLMLGGPLGLGADLTTLTMLMAEVIGGGGSAYLADRQLTHWYVKRDQHQLPVLPEARLLPPGSDE